MGALMSSLPLADTVTLLVNQPFVPGVPDTASAADGPVLSSFTVSAPAGVVRPAPFVQDASNVWPLVSAVWYWSDVQCTLPLTGSEPDVWTVTSLVYQPFAPSVPAVTAIAADGPDLSNLTVTGAAFVASPAWLTHIAPKAWPVVSSLWNWSALQLTGPL